MKLKTEKCIKLKLTSLERCLKNGKNQHRKKWEDILSILEINARGDISTDTTDIKEIIQNIKSNSMPINLTIYT